MKFNKKMLALSLATMMLAGALSGCGNSNKDNFTTPPAGTETTQTNTSETTPSSSPEVQANLTPLVVGYAQFSQKFSPFFGETAYDMDATKMTQIGLLTTDRTGAIIFNAIEGETHTYNGTDYLYQGATDVTIDYDKTADKTTYTWKLRPGMKFSDGVDVTADDVIFSLYTYCDSDYSGASTLNALNIVGLRDYKTQTSPEVYTKYGEYYDQLVTAGKDHVWSSSDPWSEEAQAGYLEMAAENEQLWKEEIQGIIDYVVGDGEILASVAPRMNVTVEDIAANEGLKVAAAMMGWGFAKVADGVFTSAVTGKTWTLQGTDFPTPEDYYNETYAAYEGDIVEFLSVESANGTTIADPREAFIIAWGSKDSSLAGKGVPNIEGIKKVDNLTVTVTLNKYDAAAIYRLGIDVSPLHYYGDVSKYDYDNNKFGFDRGDLSKQKSLLASPMGAGPYVFIKYENKIIYFEANPYYYLGEPKTKYVQFKETADADMIPGVYTGTIDISDPSFSTPAINEIKSYNSNGDLSGDKIVTTTVNNLGYGYVGICASTVSVGGVADSQESKDLRKAFATIFASYRELTVSSYYGERASVINYPISNTSWAAPRPTDQGYRTAFSLDVDGNEIYTSTMSSEEKNAAALQAAIGYLKAAGYTFDDATGKFTAAPEGAKLEYEVIIPANGNGNHPSFILLSRAKEALASIGINLIINDPADTNVLWDRIDAGTQEMWCAAWGATLDPDMYQVYYSLNAVGASPNSSGSNHYRIADAELDRLMFEARTSEDQEFRRITYKACLDIVLDWGVEVPVYQRQNCVIFSSERINMDTVTPDITTFYGWMSEIENLQMK